MSSHQLEAHRSQPVQAPAEKFTRDHLIWVYYALVGLNCYVMSALGPLMLFLQSELHLNYQVAGFHFSSFAVGTVLAGLSGDRVVTTLDRVKTLWLGVVGTVIGVICLTAGQHAAVTISGVLLCGYCASLTYQTAATVISDHLGELRTFAFVEGESAAMLGALVAPFAISGFVSASLGWRAALYSLIILLGMTLPSLQKFGSARRSEVTASQAHGKLPLAFWSYALVIFLSVCAEWSTAFWSADYLHESLLVPKAVAAAGVGSFFGGMVVGRMSGTVLVRKFSTSSLLIASSVTSIVGFLMFWLGHMLFINTLGLFLTGLGIANMYPLSFSAAVSASASQASRAIARVSLTCGTALLAAPLLLSFIADRHGLFTAYSSIAVVLVLCSFSIIWANSLAKAAKSKS